LISALRTPVLGLLSAEHVRHDLDLGQGLVLGDDVTRLHEQLGDDAADHGLDHDLLARYDLAIGDGLLHHVVALELLDGELVRSAGTLLVEEVHGPDEQHTEADEEEVLEDLFHGLRAVVGSLLSVVR
jgi:hypothetical protein